MATFYIQLKDKLQKISGDLTHNNIVKALGYTPSNFSGNFNDLSDNPFTQNEDGKFNITDEEGNIIATVDSEGIRSVDFVAGDHVLSNKANKDEIPSLNGYVTEEWVENKGYAQQTDLENIDFNTLKENPFSDDENGELNIADENGNVILKVNGNGLQTIDVVAGEHVLSNKANLSDIPSLEDYATEEWVKKQNYLTEHQDISHLATKEEVADVDFYDIKNNPIINGEEGNLIFVDEMGNIGLKLDSDNNLSVKDVVAGYHILSNKVNKEEGKGLSTEDFTTALKDKLQSLSNYDDATISDAIDTLRRDFDTLVSGDTTTAIETFNEIITFLNGVEDAESLEGIIAGIELQIANIKIPSLDGYATKTDVSDSIADIDFFSIKNNPIADTEDGNLIFVDETGNIGLKLDKDSNLTVADVVAGEHILSNKADKSDLKGLASEEFVTSQGYITEVPSEYVTETELNAKQYATKSELSSIDFDSIINTPFTNDNNGDLSIVDEQGNIGMKLDSECLYVRDVVAGNDVLSNKMDKTLFKTINGESIIGNGNITVSTGNSSANIQSVDTQETIDDVSGVPYIKYVYQNLSEEEQEQVRININAMKAGNIFCGTF